MVSTNKTFGLTFPGEAAMIRMSKEQLPKNPRPFRMRLGRSLTARSGSWHLDARVVALRGVRRKVDDRTSKTIGRRDRLQSRTEPTASHASRGRATVHCPRPVGKRNTGRQLSNTDNSKATMYSGRDGYAQRRGCL